MKILKYGNEHDVIGILFIGILAMLTSILMSLDHYGVGSTNANKKTDTHTHTLTITQTPPDNQNNLGSVSGCSGYTNCLPKSSGVIGTWTQEHEGKMLRVTGYTPCDGIASDVSERLKSLKFVCDTSDAIIYFDGDGDTYRDFLKYTSDNQIIWDEEKELPVVHTITGSAGLVDPNSP